MLECRIPNSICKNAKVASIDAMTEVQPQLIHLWLWDFNDYCHFVYLPKKKEWGRWRRSLFVWEVS